jgi:hypothetical protein
LQALANAHVNDMFWSLFESTDFLVVATLPRLISTPLCQWAQPAGGHDRLSFNYSSASHGRRQVMPPRLVQLHTEVVNLGVGLNYAPLLRNRQ